MHTTPDPSQFRGDDYLIKAFDRRGRRMAFGDTATATDLLGTDDALLALAFVSRPDARAFSMDPESMTFTDAPVHHFEIHYGASGRVETYRKGKRV